MNRFEENLNQYKKAVKFQNDTVLSAYSGPATPAPHYNIKLSEYMMNTKEGFKAYIDYVKELNDVAPINVINAPYPGRTNVLLSLMWLAKIKIPGRDLPEDSLWQVDEKPMIDEEDYDFLIENGYEAFHKRVLPRVIDLQEVEDLYAYQKAEGPDQDKAYEENGFPLVSKIVTAPPFEVLSGSRSMAKFFMDCYKKFDKIKEAQDVMQPALVKQNIELMKSLNAIGAWVGGWRGASGLVSPKIWENLVWPYMKDMANAMLENSFIPVMHLDQKWDRDIERFLELPKQSCVLNGDGMTDLPRARKILGDHMAFMGDVPAPLLSTATADKVEDYVKRLIDNVGPKGLIITSGCDTPMNAKFENLVAMYKTVAEYK